MKENTKENEGSDESNETPKGGTLHNERNGATTINQRARDGPLGKERNRMTGGSESKRKRTKRGTERQSQSREGR